MMQSPKYDDSGACVINDFRGFDGDILVVASKDRIQDMLDYRTELSRDIYYHPISKMIDKSMWQLLKVAFQYGCIDIKDIQLGDDLELRHKLQSMVQYDLGAAMFGNRFQFRMVDVSVPLTYYKDLFSMTMGFFESETWQRIEYDADDVNGIYEFLFKHRDNEAVRRKAFIVEPFDYTKKEVMVKTEDGKRQTLRTRLQLEEQDTKYVLFTPKVR